MLANASVEASGISRHNRIRNVRYLRIAFVVVACGLMAWGTALLRASSTQQTDRLPNGGALPPQPAPGPEGSLRILVIGDSGTGNENQYKVARAAEQVCAARGCDIALGLGDNIYESGIDRNLGDDDPQWVNKFEKPYENLDFPFYMTLGNHDSSGVAGGDGTDNDRGNLEVDYHYNGPGKWRMPARYFSFRYGDVEFFNIDTNPLIGVEAFAPEKYSPATYGMEQQRWLQHTLEASTATWKLVFGHHPYISNGQHGNAGVYDRVPGNGMPLKQFMEASLCDRADLYLDGHDHHLEWLKPINTDAYPCGRTEFLISGAAAKTRGLENRENNPFFFQKGDVLGFSWVVVKGQALCGAFYDGDGNKVFERGIAKGEDALAGDALCAATAPTAATPTTRPIDTPPSPTITVVPTDATFPNPTTVTETPTSTATEAVATPSETAAAEGSPTALQGSNASLYLPLVTR